MEKMKLFSFCVVAAVFMFSCEKDETVTYSCDSGIDKWVKENLTEIQTMTRSEWKQINEPVGRACYNAFTPTQKQVFWAEKFEHDLTLEWTEQEQAHIQKLANFVAEHPALFDEGFMENEALYDEFDRFTFEWKKYAETELLWSSQLINGLIASGYNLKDKTGTLEIISEPTIAKLQTRAELDCNCSTKADYCLSMECKTTNCTTSTHGCGHVWTYSCDGRCS